MFSFRNISHIGDKESLVETSGNHRQQHQLTNVLQNTFHRKGDRTRTDDRYYDVVGCKSAMFDVYVFVESALSFVALEHR